MRQYFMLVDNYVSEEGRTGDEKAVFVMGGKNSVSVCLCTCY